MNKRTILMFSTLFGIIGAYVPTIFGDTDMFSAWSLLMGAVGGFFGIWVGVVVSKRFS